MFDDDDDPSLIYGWDPTLTLKIQQLSSKYYLFSKYYNPNPNTSRRYFFFINANYY